MRVGSHGLLKQQLSKWAKHRFVAAFCQKGFGILGSVRTKLEAGEGLEFLGRDGLWSGIWFAVLSCAAVLPMKPVGE